MGRERRTHPRRFDSELQQRLRRARRTGVLRFGTPAIPYDGVEAQRSMLRQLVWELRSCAALALRLTVQSHHLLQYLEQLVELDQRHAITVDVVFPEAVPSKVASSKATLFGAISSGTSPAPAATSDPMVPPLAHRLSLKECTPAIPLANAQRFATVHQLAERGLATRILVPIGPGLRPIFAEARRIGAWDVLPLRIAERRRFKIPSLLPPNPRDPWRQVFRRLRMEYGFPRAVPGRG